jgi:uncharacterized membrane protein YdfJ with MMPL/SSD domain
LTSVRSSPRDLSRPFFLPSLLPSPSLPRTVLRNEFNAIELANQFVASPDEAKSGKWSTTISVTYDTSDPEKYNKLVGWLETQVNDLIRESSVENDVDNGACGVAPFATAILDGVQDDLEFMDSAVLPLALLILATIIQSVTLMIIPIMNILVTILAEFLVMYPVALVMDVVSFTPSLMMSITIAMSIDYSLFLLSRFKEELAAGRSVTEAIPYMIDGAGHTIAVSGGTLICCFLGMLIFPMDMLRSVGIGASVTLFFALSVNLTLTPAVLYSCGDRLVALQGSIARGAARLCNCRDHEQDEDVRLGLTGTTDNPISGASILSESLLDNDSEGRTPASGKTPGGYERVPRDGSIGSKHDGAQGADDDDERESPQESGMTSSLNSLNFSTHVDSVASNFSDASLSQSPDRSSGDIAMSKSIWYDLAWQLLNPLRGGIILLVVLALAVPICRWCLSVDISISFDMSVPEGSDAYNAFEDIQGSFGGGSVFPYTLLLVPESGAAICPGATGLMCPEGFNQINDVLNQIEENGNVHSAVAFSLGITQLGSCGPVDYEQYGSALEAIRSGVNVTSFDMSLYLLYEGFCEHADSENPAELNCNAAQVTIALEVDPYSKEGVKWLLEARRTLREISNADDAPVSVYLGQGASPTYDVTSAVYDSFPLIVIVTLSTVFLLMAVAFKSIVAPIRSVATLGLTLAFVFGLLVITYQQGGFEFMGLRCLANSHGVSWLPPVMCFSIIVGLGLDYDVFLISRVYEFRLLGYTDHAAAVKGICATGYIITAAGMIMAVAFGGLFSSQELILNQAAFLLVFAVLLDTFVVRTICVPALLGLTDTKSWWPQELPPPTKSIMY